MASLTAQLPFAAANAATTPDAYQAAVDAAVELLRSSRSLWPVDTGRSKRAWRRVGSGYRSEIFNPLRYASYVEGRNGMPAETTLRRYVASLVAAARTGTSMRVGTRAGVLEAFTRRELLEGRLGVYDEFYANFVRAGRRAPRIPRSIRQLDRRIRRLATR